MLSRVNYKYFKVENNKIFSNKYEEIGEIHGLVEKNIKGKKNEYANHVLYEKIGKNTGYILHPEEIIADNFALLLLSTNDPSVKEGIDMKGERIQRVIHSILKKNEKHTLHM